jgi:hypothetical protein
MNTRPNEDELDIGKLISINELNLEQEMATCSSYYYMVSSLAIDARMELDQRILELETYESTLSAQITADHEATRTKKTDKEITQTEVKRRFRDDVKWQLLKTQQLHAEKNASVMGKAADAIDMKSRMLTSLNKRQLEKASRGMAIIRDE